MPHSQPENSSKQQPNSCFVLIHTEWLNIASHDDCQQGFQYTGFPANVQGFPATVHVAFAQFAWCGFTSAKPWALLSCRASAAWLAAFEALCSRPGIRCEFTYVCVSLEYVCVFFLQHFHGVCVLMSSLKRMRTCICMSNDQEPF